MLRGPYLPGHLAVFHALGDKFDDSLLTFTGYACSIAFTCRHVCLRYNRVASFTRLIPPVIPKRRNNRLKCALTVLRAIFSCCAISALSQPCKSNSTICCSRGPSRMGCSLIGTSFGLFPALSHATARSFHSIRNAILRRKQQ